MSVNVTRTMEPGFVESVNSPNYWKRPREESDDRSFNFNIKPEEMEFHRGRKLCKPQRDPTSHRIIEKRRRDRMNNCLADLSRLIPHGYIKQGQGRIEKTEIIEMAIKHITTLQTQVKQNTKEEVKTSFVQGYQTCKTELVQFLVEVEGVSPSNPFCTRICHHLDNKSKELMYKGPPMKERVERITSENMESMSDIKSLKLETESKQPVSSILKAAIESPPFSEDITMPRVTNSLVSGFETDSGISLVSLTTSPQLNSQTSSDDSMEERAVEKKSYYKFKHCIRRRFSREIKSDSSSVSSLEQDREVRHKHTTSRHHKMYNSSSSSGQSSSSSSSSIQSNTSTRNDSDDGNSAPCLPGFVIHPKGTHYVPISVNQTFLPDLVDSSNYSNQNVFHPISIPVHFCSAYKLKT